MSFTLNDIWSLTDIVPASTGGCVQYPPQVRSSCHFTLCEKWPDTCQALLVYDYCLTLDVEFSVFWRCRPKLSTILYFINRYVQMMALISSTLLLFPVRDKVSVYLIMWIKAD